MQAKQKLNILFVTEASLTGAPILLLEVLKVLQTIPWISIKILVKKHDRLAGEFAQLAPTYVIKGKVYQRKSNVFVKAFRPMVTLLKKLFIYPQLRPTDVIVSNTITNGRLLQELSFLRAKTVCYVHELENLICTWKPHSDVEQSINLANFFMVPSTVVQNNLIRNHSIAKDKVTIFDTYLSVGAPDVAVDRAAIREAFCLKYGIDLNNFLVVGMGTADERKGIDLFLEIAALVNERITFVWIGGFSNPMVEARTFQSIQQSAVAEKIIFTGPLPRSFANLAPFDLFLLSSREDPYPLVMLEAAALGIPTICFEDSGGAVDFVKDGCGWTIENFSTPAMAHKISYLSQHLQDVKTAGAKAYDKFLLQHHNRDRVIEQFKNIINSVLN